MQNLQALISFPYSKDTGAFSHYEALPRNADGEAEPLGMRSQAELGNEN